MKSMTPAEAAIMLLEQHGDDIYRFVLYTVGNKADADDVVQEVFLRVVKSWHRFNHESTPKTWLWSIARNCIREYFRQQKRVQRHIALDDGLEDHRTRDVIAEMVIHESLEHLTVAQREVFVERVIHERTTAQTAELLGWSESKVRTTLHRAIMAIRKLLEKGENDIAGARP